MMNNATVRVNMENAVNAVNAANVKCSMPTQEPGIHDLLARLGELAKENRLLRNSDALIRTSLKR